ncbi:uncharacterized protein CEXT_308691 [Caerostris extrusa]|uniref:Uncharacterized protein n=1 Tax=Caerostris extrusa TaxID=172846 RepID=A0AAV4PL06_CAEEX|nr:uncharacterized protein CEXT_308691 [Caerostris extrusa]
MGRPKTFIPCYVCFKEFGSKSLTIHEPRCLERWRISNKSLPAEKRPPTPVKPADWNTSQDSICPYCQTSILTAEKDEHTLVCSAKKLRSNNNSPASKQRTMIGVVTSEFSPKKGKENKNHPNHIPVPCVVKKNAKNVAKVESKEKLNPIEKNCGAKNKDIEQQTNLQDGKTSEDIRKDGEDSSSTSKRSVRPQTKILRRPTPNLKHPVIQVDSDDSSGDSSCSSDKSKDDNPKRFKIGNESSDSTHKPKNFIIYNKNNVEKNTKKEPKERTSATMVSPSIPNPCTSCNRSQAPERLHSHAKRDSRGLMYNRKSPSLDIKMASPQKKAPELQDKPKTKSKDKSAQVQQDSKGNSVSHSASESSVASIVTKHNTLDLKKKNTQLANDDANATTSSSRKYLLDITKRCYICDEEFKVSDLLLHESQCLEVSGSFLYSPQYGGMACSFFCKVWL